MLPTAIACYSTATPLPPPLLLLQLKNCWTLVGTCLATTKTTARGQAATPDTALVGRIDHGDDFVGGECIFIPSKQPSAGSGGGGGMVSPAGDTAGDTAGAIAVAHEQDEEDDGFLVTFVSRRDGTGNSGAPAIKW